jgi:hypothetical protein
MADEISYRDQLLAKRRALMLGLADGVQQVRMPDGSGVTYVDIQHAPALLKAIDADLAVLDAGPAKTFMSFHRVNFRYF